MEKRSKDGDARCRPNKVKCTALIDCWRGSERSEAGKEAKTNISMIVKRYEERDLEMKPKPDAFVYASAIDTWARSNSPEKAAQAWIIYQQMKSQYSKGNLESKQNNVIVSRYHEDEECVNRRFNRIRIRRTVLRVAFKINYGWWRSSMRQRPKLIDLLI
jgi:hypothetical protein